MKIAARFDVEIVDEESRQHRTLIRVDEAHAEDVVALLRDLGVRRRRRDHRDFVLLADRRGGERVDEATSPMMATTSLLEMSFVTAFAASSAFD